jgi:mannose-6-phosphate isomerase-like protein (cupin superfamily)
MHVQHMNDAPVNERGGQRSYLLLRRRQFGSENLAVTWVECPPASVQPAHEHESQEQVYVIIRGRGTMVVGVEEREVREGELVFVPPRTAHHIRNDGDETMTYVSATAPPFDAATLDPVFAYRER